MLYTADRLAERLDVIDRLVAGSRGWTTFLPGEVADADVGGEG